MSILAVLAIDIGGTSVKSALVDGDGRVMARHSVPTGKASLRRRPCVRRRRTWPREPGNKRLDGRRGRRRGPGAPAVVLCEDDRVTHGGRDRSRGRAFRGWSGGAIGVGSAS